MGEAGRSLAETPTWSVATVTTLMVAACFLVERSLSRFAKWLRKTKRKAMLAALEKIREELMLLGVISLLLSQTAHWISEICVPSKVFTSRFYICSENDFDDLLQNEEANQTSLANHMLGGQAMHVCSEGHEPFVSYEGLEQLHRFLFILGITHVLYSFVTVVLSMIKIYSWRKWETLAGPIAAEELKARRTKVMRRQSTFVFHHASHPWSKNKILIWMLCFLRQFKGSITRSDYLALRLGFVTYHKLPHSYDFHKYMVRSMEDDYNGTIGISWPLWAYAIICILINVHGINIYFWLSFVPVILVLLVGTELQHVVAQLALEVAEATAPYVGTQLKLRDDLFWFGKPRVLWWLIQFISFQNAFEMATFLWSLWELSSVQSCFMKHNYMVVIRLISGLLVQFWCSCSTLPLNVIISQMGSKFKKSLVSENVRESLHSWCKRVKDRSRHNPLFSRNGTVTSRSVCSLDTTYETDHETNTVCTLSRTASASSLDDQLTVATVDDEPSFMEKDV
ncbi:MLO-like protein 4 [Phragmites australis]|uniref:MLO-like protein 4 n=1 Tax=Phragmites australis TaxID=29695 RepID=UPI002D7744F5|nr:MLO-like protein 4 [Phragmites australis]